MAGAPPSASVENAFAPSLDRAVLRRACCRARTDAGSSAPERRESTRDQFLSMASERFALRHSDGERRNDVLPAPGTFQHAPGERKGRESGSSGTLLLSESNGLQRSVPVQPHGRIQRAVWPVCTYPL